VKTFLARLLVSAALLLGLVSARAQSLYVHKELFQIGASASGTHTAAGLNNRGEVFYLYSPAKSPSGSSVPGLWLARPNYGLPAGFSPLTSFQALARSALPWFADDGTFYTSVTNADQGNAVVYRGSAAGESQLCSQLTYGPAPTISVTAYNGSVYDYYCRRMFVVDGVTASGQPFGHMNVQTSGNILNPPPSGWGPSGLAASFRLNGAFVGFPPDAPVTAIGTLCGPGGLPKTITSSPNGTMLIFNDLCCGPYWPVPNLPYVSYEELAVAHLDSARNLLADPHQVGGTEYPGAGSALAERAFGYPSRLTVNDSGDAAGVTGSDWAVAGDLWLSPNTGEVVRAGRTNVSSVVLDPAGSVWFVSNFYQDIWRWDEFPDVPVLDSQNRLNLPWTDWGYTGVPALVFANNRGQLLVHALKADKLSYAVLLSPMLNVALTVSTNRVSVGDELTVTATITALGDELLTGVEPAEPPAWSGTGAFEPLSGPSPAPPWSLQPGGQMQAEWQCQATTNGAGRFTLTLKTPTLVSLPAHSESVRIVPGGDLLIKRGMVSDNFYAGLGVFQTSAAPPQVLTNFVAGSDDSSTFAVQIRNNDPRPQAYTLEATQVGDAVWQAAFSLFNIDVTAELEAAGGMTLPLMSPGEVLTLTVEVGETQGLPGDLDTLDIKLGLADDPTLRLDVVEAKTLVVAPIVVNSTGDLPLLDPNGCCCDTGRKLAGTNDNEAECTLRAAIELANILPGVNIIQFAVPETDPDYHDNSPRIQPESPLPEITSSTIVDGRSQDPNSEPPPVEIYAPAGEPAVLEVFGANCEFYGLVLNGFPKHGIHLNSGADASIIQDNYIGLNSAGTEAVPSGGMYPGAPTAGILIESSHNQVGGDGTKGSNVILVSPGSAAEPVLIDDPATFAFPAAGGTVAVWVGDTTPSATNGATDNSILDNYLGTRADGTDAAFFPNGLPVARPIAGVWLNGVSGNRVGSLAASEGNLISDNEYGVVLYLPSATGNQIYANVLSNNDCGILVVAAPTNAIGGSGVDYGNTLYKNGSGIQILGETAIRNIIQNNLIQATKDPEQDCLGILIEDAPFTLISDNTIESNALGGIVISGQVSYTLVLSNVISGNGLGIDNVASDFGNTFRFNKIYGNTGLGIDLSPPGPNPVQLLNPKNQIELDDGALETPELAQVTYSGGTLAFQLSLLGKPNTNYDVDLYDNDLPGPLGFGQGQRYLDTLAVQTGVAGGVFLPRASLSGVAVQPHWLTANATDDDGNSSEFSRAILVPDGPVGLNGLGQNTENQCPNLNGPGGTGQAGPHPLDLSAGDGNGDGILDSLQSNVASLPTIAGLWVTLAATNGTAFEHVVPSGAPNASSPPSGYVFPIGFLGFGLTNLPASGAVIITNFLHLWADTNFAYSATTYLNYGPTPDNAAPHWYPFLYDGTTGAELFPDRIILHFHDGAKGDNDLAVNGDIETVGGPAYQARPGPVLTVQLISASQSGVTVVLSWPARATNYALVTTDNLSATHFWQPVLAPPVVVGSQNVVTNTTSGAAAFYQLLSASPF